MSCYLRGTHESELDLAKPKHLIWVRARFKQSLRNFQGWSCYHVVKLGVLFQQAARKGGEWLIWDSNGDTLQRIQTWNVTVITVCVCVCVCAWFLDLPGSMWCLEFDGILSASSMQQPSVGLSSGGFERSIGRQRCHHMFFSTEVPTTRAKIAHLPQYICRHYWSYMVPCKIA